MLYDQDFVFVNGESWRCRGKDASVLRQLADQRQLSKAEVYAASPKVRECLLTWWEAGWLNSLPVKKGK
jgi:50S ribosomal protein L16 3-hydroxylase